MLANASPPQVLVVENYGPMKGIYCSLFQQLGLQVRDITSHAEEAFDVLSSRNYAVVVSDWYLTGVSGLQLLKRVRARPALSTIPFIMASAESRPCKVLEAREAGATDYLVKPFNVGLLRSTLVKASPLMAAVLSGPIVAPSVRDLIQDSDLQSTKERFGLPMKLDKMTRAKEHVGGLGKLEALT